MSEESRMLGKSIDEFKIFGDYVASEIRNIKSRLNQNRLKRVIEQAVVEMSEFDDKVLPSSVIDNFISKVDVQVILPGPENEHCSGTDIKHQVFVKEEFVDTGSEACINTPNEAKYKLESEVDLGITNLKEELQVPKPESNNEHCYENVKTDIYQVFVKEEVVDTLVGSETESLRNVADEEKHKLESEVDLGITTSKEVIENKCDYFNKNNKKLHTCTICKKSFHGASKLAQHRLVHTGEKPYKCSICQKGYTRASDMKAHEKRHLSDNSNSGIKIIKKRHMCDICKKYFTKASSLKKHQIVHTGVKSYKCPMCDKTFGQSSYLTIHKRLHTGEKPFKCEVCQKAFAQKSNYSRHRRIHGQNSNKQTRKRDLTDNDIGNSKQHEIVHSGVKSYKCLLCDKTFRQFGYLRIHKRLHTGEKPFKCELCQKTFSQKSNYTRHRQIHGKSSNNQRRKRDLTNDSGKLKKHHIVNSGVKSYKCNFCEKKFGQSSYLKIHKRLHTGEKPFKCEVCQKMFAQKSNYFRHCRTHGKNSNNQKKRRDLSDNDCGNLKKHTIVHSGVKSYKCNICDKKFGQSSYLKIHRRLHTGEKPFKCEVCQKTFSQKSNYYRHRRTHGKHRPQLISMTESIHNSDACGTSINMLESEQTYHILMPDNKSNEVDEEDDYENKEQVEVEKEDQETMKIMKIITRQKFKRTNVQKKPTRKRKLDPVRCKDFKAKCARNSGIAGRSRSGKIIECKKMRTGCKMECRFKCQTKITLEDRQLAFNKFWILGDHVKQWTLLSEYTNSYTAATPCDNVDSDSDDSDRGKIRLFHSYFLPSSDGNVKVCRTMFLDTFGISKQWIQAIDKKMQEGNGSIAGANDNRGRHKNRPFRVPEVHVLEACNHIELFPTMESHYCRENSQRKYLEEGLSIRKMYRMYADKMKEENKCLVSEQKYRQLFNTKYNYGFFQPKKDRCEKCHVFTNMSAAEKLANSENYDLHIKNKKEIRNLMKADKLMATENKDICVLNFNMQKVLTTPRVNIDPMYYLSKLNVYNYTIFDLAEQSGRCYVWNETIGGRSSSEIASFLYSYISQKTETIKQFVLYSDSCGGQNKNKIVFSMLMKASKEFDVDITYRFFEVGHIQCDGDSMHARIENHSAKKCVYTQTEWCILMREANVERPYTVTEVLQKDIVNFSELSSLFQWQIIKISKLKEITFKKDERKVLIKYNILEDPLSVDVIKNNYSIDNIKTFRLVPIYDRQFELTEKKKKDLSSMVEKGLIPNEHIHFYNCILQRN